MHTHISRRWFFAGLVYGLALFGFLTQAWGLAERYAVTIIGAEKLYDQSGQFDDGYVVPVAIDPDEETVIGTLFAADYPEVLQLAPTFRRIAPKYSEPFDVEDGLIVGYAFPHAIDPSYITEAVVWEHGVMRALPTAPMFSYVNGRPPRTIALCVNGAGDIWGAGMQSGSDVRSNGRPLEWVNGELLLALPTLGGDKGVVWACNDGGDSAGWSLNRAGEKHCTEWFASGEMTDCHPHHGTSESQAVALNNRGLLAGNATQYGRSFGFLRYGPGLWWLMPLPGEQDSQVRDVNETGDAVGVSGSRAVGWESHNQHPVDLASRIVGADTWNLGAAVGISDDGVIVATGTRQGDLARNGYPQVHIVLLTPVETPTAAYFAWKARIYNWYVKQYQLAHRPHER